MGVSAVLSATSVTVAPGNNARCTIRIRNTGAVVDQFTIRIVGESAGWTVAEPPQVNLLPAAEQAIDLVFAPPRSFEVAAGSYPFSVRIASREDPETSVVEEAAVVVEPFTDLAADLVPRSSHGRRVGKHTVAVDNLGNHPLPVDLMTVDPDDQLVFRVRPRSITAVPGTATFVSVRARPKKPFWKGTDKTLPFQVEVSPAGADPITVTGVMLQRQLLPRGFLTLLALLFAAAMLLVIMLNTILASEPISTARTAMPATTTPTSPRPSGTSSRPTPTPTVRPTGTGSRTPGPSPGSTGSQTRRPSVPAPSATVRTVSIEAHASPRTGGPAQTFSYAVPFGKTFSVGGVRLQNPAGDSGVLQILRGHAVLLSVELKSFRTKAYQPSWRVGGGQEIVVSVDCENPSTPCTPGVALSGTFG